MSKYILESHEESYRLDFQSKQRNYNPYDELKEDDIYLDRGSLAIDAGSGTGILSRYIADVNRKRYIKIFGVDTSSKRIEEANDVSIHQGYKNIFYQVGDLRKLDFENDSADLIVCRLVYEHIQDCCQQVTNEFSRVLKRNGKLIIIDIDGLFYNLQTENTELNRLLEIIKRSDFNFDGDICKKIPRFLQRAGFKKENISIKTKQMMFFDDFDKNYERTLWRMRFKQIESIITHLLGEEGFKTLSTQYMKELMNPENFLYYNKFVFSAVK